MANVPAIREIKSGLTKMEGEFAKALPGHISPERFVRTAQTAVAMTRNIEKVQDVGSLYAACTKAASDGLILDGREAALVVDYQGAVQYRPMMRGLLKLAWQSNELRGIVVEVVRKGDMFRHSPTNLAQPIQHEIDHENERGEPHTVYAMAELKTGGIIHEVMSVADVNRIRDRSDAYKAFKASKIKSTPWHTDWSEMARKTVFRRLSKYLPSSTDLEGRLHSAAEQIDADYTFVEDEQPAQAGKPASKKRGSAAAALKDVIPAEDVTAAESAPEAGQDNEPPPAEEYDPETGEVIDPTEPQPDDDI